MQGSAAFSVPPHKNIERLTSRRREAITKKTHWLSHLNLGKKVFVHRIYMVGNKSHAVS